MKAKPIILSLVLLMCLSASAFFFTKAANESTIISLSDNSTKSYFRSATEIEREQDLGMKRIELDENKEFAEQLTRSNTIYTIKHNYNLNGKEVIIPENCILEFAGGTLSNGVVRGQNTSIQAGLYKIFNIDITIEGQWNVPEAYPEWFGAVSGNSNIDSRLAIQKTMDGFSCTKLCGEVYYLLSNDAGVGIKVPYGKTLCGINHFRGSSNKGKTGLKAENRGINHIVEVDHYCVVKDINVEGNLGDYYNHTNSELTGLYGYDVSYMKFENVYVVNTSYGFRMCAWCVSYINCRASYCNIGFSVFGRPATRNKGAATMTSNNFINCTCLSTTLCHFSLSNAIKCVFIGCGGDCCGYRFDANGKKVRAFDIPATNQTDFYTNAVFRFENCSNFTLLNCTTEMSFRALSMSSVSDITIEDFHFTFYYDNSKEVDNAAYLSSIVFMSGFSGVNYNDNKTFYNAPEGWDGRYVTLNNYERSNKHNNTFKLSPKEVKLSVLGDNSESVFKRISFDYNEDIESSFPSSSLYVNNTRVTEYRFPTENISFGKSANTSFIDYAGTTTLHFFGNATNRNIMDLSAVKAPILFKGFKRVIIENYIIRYDKPSLASYRYSHLIKCENTEIVIKNCLVTIGVTTSALEHLLECENSKLVFEDTYQVIETDDYLRIAASNDVIKSTLNIERIANSDLPRVSMGQVRLPSGTIVIYTNNKNGVYDDGSGHAPFNTDAYATDGIPRFTTTNNLLSAEKWFAIGSQCHVGNTEIVTWNGERWINSDHSTAGVRRIGTFSQRPSAEDIYIGFRYFCTDRYTPEGGKDNAGIDIIHKGNNKWVDALGRELK